MTKNRFLYYTLASAAFILHGHAYAQSEPSNASATEEQIQVEEAAPQLPVIGDDSVFREALISTYVSNPRIIAQRKAFEETGESYNQALSGWLPTITARYGKGRRRNRTAGADWSYLDAEDRELNLSQPIVDVSTYFELGQADNTIKASGAELIDVTQTTLLSGISAYLDVVRDRDILDLSRNNETVLGRNLAATRERFDVGEATRTDTSQSEARLSRAESDTIQAQGNLAIAEATFERVIGYEPIEGLIYPETMPEIPATLDELLEEALQHNPSVVAARYNEEAASDAVGANVSDLLPVASLDGSASRAEGSGFTGVDFDSDSVLLNVTLPLYRGGAQYSRIREAKTQKSRRRYELMEATNEVQQQTITAWEEYQTALAAIEAQKDTIRAAEIALDGVQQEQLYGSRTVLDVLDAEQELFVARVNLARSERNRLVSVYNLLSVMGKLSPEALGLGVDAYDREEAYDNIKYQLIGF